MATPIPTNRAAFTLAQVAEATEGTLVGAGAGAGTVVTGVSTDTRDLVTGALFVALRGHTHDGHAHLAQAEHRGAAAAVVCRGTHCSLPRIEVDDTLVALGRLACFHADRVRASREVPSVAITGSAGKTTTKGLTAAAVEALYGRTLATVGNLNNLVGVPMTLLTLEEEHRAMVIECGTNARGEIARLGEMVSPDVALVLNADAGHTEGIGSVSDVAVEKGALFAAAKRAVVGNADDAPSLGQIGRARAHVRSLTFGQSEGADVRLFARTFGNDGRTRITVEFGSKVPLPEKSRRIDLELGLLGRAAALDATAALAAVVALRGSALTARDVSVAADAFKTLQPTAGRLSPQKVGDALVLDDTYNANPRSARAALEAASELARGLGTRLVIALGDMLELGSLSAELHVGLAEDVLRSGAVLFVSVGPQMALAARAVARAGQQGLSVVETVQTDDAAIAIARALRPGDVVLVKGSRGMAMERVIEALVKESTGLARKAEGNP